MMHDGHKGMKKMGKKAFIETEKRDIKEAKQAFNGYPAKKKPGKVKK